MSLPALFKAYSHRGSDMGRPDLDIEPEAEVKLRLYLMPMYDGDYDSGGAYWGAGNHQTGWMYHAYGDGPEGRNELFLRAKDREEAKKKVLEVFKKAKFYR